MILDFNEWNINESSSRSTLFDQIYDTIIQYGKIANNHKEYELEFHVEHFNSLFIVFNHVIEFFKKDPRQISALYSIDENNNIDETFILDKENRYNEQILFDTSIGLMDMHLSIRDFEQNQVLILDEEGKLTVYSVFSVYKKYKDLILDMRKFEKMNIDKMYNVLFEKVSKILSHEEFISTLEVLNEYVNSENYIIKFLKEKYKILSSTTFNKLYAVLSPEKQKELRKYQMLNKYKHVV